MPPNVHLQDVSDSAHIFNEARKLGANVDLHFVSMTDKSEIKSSTGIFLTKLTHFDIFDLSKNDFIIVPGLEYGLLSKKSLISENKSFFDWLHFQYTQGVRICSICNGMFLLVEAGILNSRECTTFCEYTSHLNNEFPKNRLQKNRLFIIKDNLYTSAGVSSGVDLSLYIIENLFGPKISSDIAKKTVVHFTQSGSNSNIDIFLKYRDHSDSRIHKAQDYMLEHLSSAITNNDIAEHVNMSMRNLTRLFKKNTGITIGTYLEKIRVDRASHLLSKKNKVETVAKLCGYKNSNQLRVLFKRHKRILPKDISILH